MTTSSTAKGSFGGQCCSIATCCGGQNTDEQPDEERESRLLLDDDKSKLEEPKIEKGEGKSVEGQAFSKNEYERVRLEKMAGKMLIILSLISFVFVGLLINCLQLILVCTQMVSKNRRWRQLHKKWNGNLVHALFIQPTFIVYLWSRIRMIVTVSDLTLIEQVKQPLLGIIIANHTYELDWLACFVMADQLGNMGAYKSFTKAELKYLPIIGWAFWMSDLVYVRRDWRRDKEEIGKQLDELLHYEQLLLGIFAEGTRFTDEKHRASIEFAKNRNLVPFKHHLVPRTRGFTLTLRHFLRRATVDKELPVERIRLFNLQIAMPERRNFGDFLEGRQLTVHVHCEEVYLEAAHLREALEADDPNECPQLAQLLMDIFRRKDQLMEEYTHNGNKFTIDAAKGSGYFPIKRPIVPFIYWLVGMCTTYGSLAYLALTVYRGSVLFWSLVALLITSGMLMLKRIESESKVHKKLLSPQTDTYGRLGNRISSNQ